MSPTVATQSRKASLTASLSVRDPLCTDSTSAAEQLHPEHVERLALDVDGAHVDLALEPHQRRRGGGGDAVLAGPGLGDQPGLAHPLGEQRLPEHVVDLVRAGVVEVLTLEQHPEAELLAEAVALGEHRRAAGVVAEDVVELGAERRVGPCRAERRLEFLACRDQGLGHEATAELSEPAGGVGLGHQRVGVERSPSPSFVGPVVGQLVGPEVGRGRGGAGVGDEPSHLGAGPCCRARPRRRWTTSTPHGSTTSIASATLSGSSPPARITRTLSGTSDARPQSNTLPEPGDGASTRTRSVP